MRDVAITQKNIRHIDAPGFDGPEPFRLVVSLPLQVERAGIGKMPAGFIENAQIKKRRRTLLQLEQNFIQFAGAVDFIECERVCRKLDVRGAVAEKLLDQMPMPVRNGPELG